MSYLIESSWLDESKTEEFYPVKLWHDDIRPPPTGFDLWAKTNDAALIALMSNQIRFLSMDHDMGAVATGDPNIDMFQAGASEETGLRLVETMIKMPESKFRIPDFITIHSWNPVGAERMRTALEKFYKKDSKYRERYKNHTVKIKPYEL